MVYAHAQKRNAPILWNLSELNTPAGIYIYQVNIKTANSNYVSKAGKLIITQ